MFQGPHIINNEPHIHRIWYFLFIIGHIIPSNIAFVEYYSKVLAASHKDYIQHNKRKRLTLKTGFEQKNYAFLMEDTTLSVENLLTLFGKNAKIKKSIMRDKNGLRNAYGCLYKTKLNLKLTSAID